MTDELRRRRLIAVISVAVAIAALGFLAFGGIGESLVYYWSPSEMLAAGDRAEGASIRLGGLVETGSIEVGANGLDLRFAVTDGQASVPVHAEAVPPAMFREGIGVLIEGTLTADGHFESERLMVKHDNQYRAPDEADKIDVEEMARSMKFESGG